MHEPNIEIIPVDQVEPMGLSAHGGDPSGKHQLFVQTFSEAQVDFLLQRTPKSEIKVRPGRGGMQFSYVEHGYVTERLNLVFGFNWDFEVVDKQMLDDEVIVEAKLTVRTPGGQTIVKTQFGGAEIKRHASGTKNGKPLSIADDYKAAASDALKKCASLLGIGLDLYGRDRVDDQDAVQPQSSATTVGGRVTQLDSRSPGLCTAAQVKAILQAAHAKDMSKEKLCARLNVRDLAELTEARAQRVLERLQEMARLEGQQEAS